MNITLASLQYLHAWDSHQPISGGVAFEDLLREHALDYSVQSLGRIDAFLDKLRNGKLIQAEAVSNDARIQSLFYLLAFYVGEVIGRSVQSEPQWLSFEEYNEKFPGDPSDRCFETSIVLLFTGNPEVRVPIFKPLISIFSRAFDEDVEKSVKFSAGAQIPVDLQTGPASEEPLAPWPVKPWPVDVGAWFRSVSALDMDAFAIRVPIWGETDDLHRLFDRAQDLLLGGRVVWGAVVQANSGLLDQSGSAAWEGGAPAEVLYDPDGRAPPDALIEVARLAFGCKGKPSNDEALSRLSNHLANESTRAFGMDVPHSLSPYPLKISTTWFSSRHLHLAHLALSYVPLLVSQDHPGLVLPLPSRLWSPEFMQAWQVAAERAATAKGKPIYIPPMELAHLQPMSLVEEGFLYFQGRGVAQNYEKARHAWEKAASRGNFSAYRRLAGLYEGGFGVEKDWRRAVANFELAAQNGCKESKNDAERLRVEAKMGAAFPGAVADRRSPDELCTLAVQYLEAEGSGKDVDKAIALLKRGAKRGHANSLHNLGSVYNNGDDLPRNGRVAMGYFQRAADRGSVEAKEYLAKRKRTLIGLFEWYFRVR